MFESRLSRQRLAEELLREADGENCGTGDGGFKGSNTCAKGDGSEHASRKYGDEAYAEMERRIEDADLEDDAADWLDAAEGGMDIDTYLDSGVDLPLAKQLAERKITPDQAADMWHGILAMSDGEPEDILPRTWTSRRSVIDAVVNILDDYPDASPQSVAAGVSMFNRIVHGDGRVESETVVSVGPKLYTHAAVAKAAGATAMAIATGEIDNTEARKDFLDGLRRPVGTIGEWEDLADRLGDDEVADIRSQLDDRDEDDE